LNLRLSSAFVAWLTISMVVITLILASGCTKGSQVARTPDELVVEVAPVEQRDVPIYSEWIGTLDGYVNSDIKAQVPGYLLKQSYTEGSFVHTGQMLFEIDPRPFQAAVDQATGQLASGKNAIRCGSLHPAG
jgi:membrane fusion protein (multidrug efflux system)